MSTEVSSVPIDCRPLTRYKIVRSRSILMLAILDAFWFNWQQITIRQIREEILNLRWVYVAYAKQGFWLKYPVRHAGRKFNVEFFIRTVPNSSETECTIET